MKIGRIITAPFRLIIAIANFIRALIIIMFFAVLILLLAYVFSPRARSCMNGLILERKDKILERKTAEQIPERKEQITNKLPDYIGCHRLRISITFKNYLKALTFLPISNMLNITMTELMCMPQRERDMLRRKLDQYHIPMLLNDVMDDKKFPHGDDLSFGWIPAEHLP